MSEPEAVSPIDSADARLAAARRYLATVPVIEEWIPALAVHLGDSPARRDQLRTLLAAHAAQIETAHVASMVRHLTAADIEALAQFQASPAGRSVMRKMGAFQTELVPALMPLLRSVVEDALRPTPPREGA